MAKRASVLPDQDEDALRLTTVLPNPVWFTTHLNIYDFVKYNV